MQRVRSAVKLDIALSKAATLNILAVKLFWCGELNGIEITQKAFAPYTGSDRIIRLGTDLGIIRNVSISDKITANMLVDLDREKVSRLPAQSII